MRPLLLCLTLLLFLASIGYGSDEEEKDYTSRVHAVLGISALDANKTIYAEEGDEFNVSVKASCYNASCGTVEIYLFHCSGKDCINYTVIGSDSYYPIYVWGDSYYRCLMIEKSQVCAHTWKVRAKKPGLYSLVFIAQSTNTGAVYSDQVDVEVSGCGDGFCSGGEDHVRCARDCCEEDCSSSLDEFCHSKCSGYNNCSFSSDCDGKPAGYKGCVSNTSYISCCSVGVKVCGFGEYCRNAFCLNCSMKCDGVCDSPACYRIDPDCDPAGSASLPCCGNNLIDEGEECDGYMSFCAAGCGLNCRCAASLSSSTLPATSSTTTLGSPEETLSPTSTTALAASSSTLPSDSGKGGLRVEHAGLVLVILFLLLFIPKFISQRKVREDYDSLVAREGELEAKRTKVFSDFKANVLTEDVASRMILGIDKELESVRKKISKEAGKLLDKGA